MGSPPKGWIQKPVKIILRFSDNSEESKRLDAHWLGTLAVHASHNQPGKWTVTVGKLGLLVTEVTLRADAYRIATILWQRNVKAFTQPTKELTLEWLRQWVEPWCRRCRRKSRYVPSKPFRKRDG
jgi:hypothetical protein